MNNILRRLIRPFDALLRRIYRVYEFCDDPDCIVRLSQSTTRHPIQISELHINKGDPVLEIHLWNEHIPALSASEDSLAWASRFFRSFIYSLKLAAGYIQQKPELANYRAIRGTTSVLFSDANPDRPRLMERFGFKVMPFYTPLGAFGEFWENFYAWWIMWTYNPLSLRSRNLFTIHRTEVWMGIDEFLKRYGQPGGS